MNYAHHNLSSTTQSPGLTMQNTLSYVDSTSVNRVVSEHAFVIPPTKEFTCYVSTDAICTTSCSVGLSTSKQVTYSTYNKGVVSSHTIQTGEFKSLSHTHHSIQVTALQVNTGAIGHMHIRECSMSRMMWIVIPIMVILGMKARVVTITIGITRDLKLRWAIKNIPFSC